MHTKVTMRRRRASIAVVAVALAASLVAAPGAASKSGPQFTKIVLPGAAMTHVYAINAQGDLAGSYVAGGKTLGFVLAKSGALTTIDYPGAVSTEAWGINARGDVVGRYVHGGRVHGFLLRDGVLSNVDVPGEDNTMPTGISDDGKIVGCYHTSPWGLQPPAYMHGYVQDGDEFTRLPVLQSMNNGVAAGGNLVAGLRYDPDSGRVSPYVSRNGSLTQLAVPGALDASAWDVNARGEVVGFYSDGSRAYGWVLAKGAYATVDVPGSFNTWAYGINARGQVVGVYTDESGMHGFVLER
jgi:uncharacterized membrane protein